MSLFVPVADGLREMRLRAASQASLTTLPLAPPNGWVSSCAVAPPTTGDTQTLLALDGGDGQRWGEGYGLGGLLRRVTPGR